MSRRGFGVLVAVALLATATNLALHAYLRPAAETATNAAHGFYQCAMHPRIVSDQPGICPICQMRLEHVDLAAPASAPLVEARAPGEARAPLFYRHPMRPDVTSAVPAKDEMGMDYVAVFPDDVAGGASDVPGHAPFVLPAERQQLIGVTHAPVEKRSLEMEVRSAGKVAYDPSLFQAIAEYREALRAQGRIAASSLKEAHEGAASLVRSAALRLRQQGLSEAQIRAVDRGGADPVNLLLPGESVWVYAQVYEFEVGLIHPGARVAVTAPSNPGTVYAGEVVAVDPLLNPTTRTARVRVLVPTPGGTLRPESFVHVTISVPLGETLALPADAVMDTGRAQYVFVVGPAGEFTPRAVTLGREAQGFSQVLEGVSAGEEVVTSANFLIDSESRFRAALAAFSSRMPPASSTRPRESARP